MIRSILANIARPVAGAAVLAVALGVAAPIVGAAGNGNEVPVTLQPADSHGGTVGQAGYFTSEVSAGAHSRLFALVGNASRTRAGIQLVPVDASSGVFGGITYNLPEQPRRLVGRWIHLQRSRITLDSGKTALVRFSVRVPAGTPPGQYVGGLSAFVPAPQLKKSHHIAALRVQIRAVTAVVVTVPGPTSTRFTAGAVSAAQRPDATYAIVPITNSGNTLLYGQGNLWVTRPGHRGPVLQSHLVIGMTVPHTTVNYPVLWSRTVQPGRYRAHVILWWNGGSTSSYFWFSVSQSTSHH